MSDRAFDKLARRLISDEEIANRRAWREIIAADSSIKGRAIPRSVLASALYFRIPGAIPAGSNVADQWEMPTTGRFRTVRAYLKTAPSGGNLNLTLLANGAAIATLVVKNGQTTGFQVANDVVPAGSLMTIQSSAALGADASITARFDPAPEG